MCLPTCLQTKVHMWTPTETCCGMHVCNGGKSPPPLVSLASLHFREGATSHISLHPH